MLKCAFRNTLLCNDCLQPTTGVRTRLHVFILTCAPDMLHKSDVIRDVSENDGDSCVRVLRADLLRPGTELDEVLEKYLYHRV